MATRNSTLPVCAWCGRTGLALFQFPLLSAACEQGGVRLRVRSDWFHPRCSRAAWNELPPFIVTAFANPADNDAGKPGTEER